MRKLSGLTFLLLCASCGSTPRGPSSGGVAPPEESPDAATPDARRAPVDQGAASDLDVAAPSTGVDGAPAADLGPESDGLSSPMPPPATGDEPLPPCLRRVKVITSAELASALTAAHPGDCIDLDDGSYTFTTIKPGPYPWKNHHNAWRPAHIHFSVFGHSFVSRLVTQMYFPGDPLFPFDPIFNSVTDEKARNRMISSFDLENTKPDWALCYRFDIVLRGRNATPMENK